MAGRLAREMAPLARTAEDRRQARHAPLGLLARETNADTTAGLAGRLGPLDPTAEDKRQARHALLGLAGGGEFLRQAVRERGRHLGLDLPLAHVVQLLGEAPGKGGHIY